MNKFHLVELYGDGSNKTRVFLDSHEVHGVQAAQVEPTLEHNAFKVTLTILARVKIDAAEERTRTETLSKDRARMAFDEWTRQSGLQSWPGYMNRIHNTLRRNIYDERDLQRVVDWIVTGSEDIKIVRNFGDKMYEVINGWRLHQP